ncbi:MAG: phosphate acyltransferase PlsX [Tunicatimonas sp.]|uniref:phosphate acyltransferase PlsX n=1 Tax=Tunicatimonas sp. TaxID=1940096 RepID=UPI003C75FED2
MRIALDAMGGDFAPKTCLEGATLAIREFSQDDRLVLVGQQETIKEHLAHYEFPESMIEIVHAEEVIGMHEHPTKAFSQKKHSSIGIGFHLLKEEKIDAFCSAGNTGAMSVGAMFSVKPCEGVIRPALAGFAPREDGSYGVLIDVGANADVKPEILVQFGEIGSLYAQHVFGIDRPKVGLINLGEEEQKGTVVTQAAYQLFKEQDHIHFIGNIEGRDIFRNKADVMVCNGYVGNVVLKLAESVYDLLKSRDYHDPFFDNLNYEAIGGSPILGINGNVVIGHGSSSALAIKNMIMQAFNMAKSDIYHKIRAAFQDQLSDKE